MLAKYEIICHLKACKLANQKNKGVSLSHGTAGHEPQSYLRRLRV